MKHLQADLHTLFKPDLLPSLSLPLPSGPPYIRPMTISAIQASIYFRYRPYDGYIYTLHPDNLASVYPIWPSKPAKRQRRGHWDFSFMFLDSKAIFTSYDDALLDMFINHRHTRDNPEFPRILHLYPEYFI